MKWRVWIGSYEGSYSEVDASGPDEAMRKGVRKQPACWGETVEICAKAMSTQTALTYRRLTYIDKTGKAYIP